MISQKTAKSKNIGFTHDDFAALLDKYDYHFNPGDIVPGTVFSMEPRGALIDIGAKTAAFIPVQEMSINRVDDPEEVLQANETREFFILTDENEDGQLTLSIRRIEYMRAWERVRQLQAEDATVRSQVFATNRGGALVRIEGLRGFIPGSHISTKEAKEDLVGQDLALKFLEVDEDRNRLVLSHRRALVERKMNGLEVGQVVIGSVRGIKPYGAFIDIGGVSGLLHISEISHDHIDTPHSVFNVNDELKVMIIDLDAERGRISLSTKQLEPEAGDMLKNRQAVIDRAEEMAAKYREKLRAQAAGIPVEVEVPAAVEELVPEAVEVPPAMEELVIEEPTLEVAETAAIEEPTLEVAETAAIEEPTLEVEAETAAIEEPTLDMAETAAIEEPTLEVEVEAAAIEEPTLDVEAETAAIEEPTLDVAETAAIEEPTLDVEAETAAIEEPTLDVEAETAAIEEPTLDVEAETAEEEEAAAEVVLAGAEE